MSLLSQQSQVNAGTSFFALAGSGGGGGSVGPNPSFSTITLNTIAQAVQTNTSSIAFANTATSGNQIVMGFTESTSASIGLIAQNAADGISIAVDNGSSLISFSGGNGALSNVSSINGASYPPPGLQYTAISTPTTVIVPQNGTEQVIAAFSTTVGNLYEVRLNPTIAVAPAIAPAPGAFVTFFVPFNAISEIDLAQVSTLGNNFSQNLVGTFYATDTGMAVKATGTLFNTVSTSITFSPPYDVVWYKDLGVPLSNP
jgi:hypothetical protein